MTGRLLLLCACCLLWACAAELDPGGVASESRHPLEGDWHLEATQTDNTCPEFDLFGTVDVTTASFHRARDGWTLRAQGHSMRFDEVEPGLWVGQLEAPYERCTLSAESRWDFEAVGPTSFAAWRTTSFRVHGADCGTAEDACTVTYAVRGLR